LKPDDFVVRENDALLLDTPKLVTAGAVVQALWSPSGKHVLAWRAETDMATALAGRPEHETTLVLWTRATRKQKELWKGATLDTGVEQVEWLPNSESALAVVRRPAPPAKGAPPTATLLNERWLMLVDARQGTFRPLTRLPEGAMVMASPRRPFAVVQSRSPRLLAIVRADGAIRDLSAPELKLPTGMGFWTADGSALRFNGPTPPMEVGQRRPPVFLLDPETVKLTGPFTADEVRQMSSKAQPSTDAPTVAVKGSVALIREKDSGREVTPLWIEASNPSIQRRAMVSAHARDGALSPTGDAVLYLDDGGAWVRPLLPVDKAVFQVAWERTQRDLRMAHAKQTGIGIMMFAADNQESLPAEGSDLQSLLARYSLKSGALDEFVYVFPGGKLKDIAEPANTHLGYIPAPGGRVVLFVDGHVKFMPE
jgi:prepilin-type processing-associated H-X9-DG protein